MGPPSFTPRIDGAPFGPTLVFVHGWPDHPELWDELVGALADRYRCVRFELPNYGEVEQRRWGFSHDEMVEGLARAICESSPGVPVTLVIHDWGAYWGYLVHHRHPELVLRIVGLDIAPSVHPTWREATLIASYQWFLASAWVIGGPIGNWMTRGVARFGGAPLRGRAPLARMNFPYFYSWRDIFAGRRREVFRGYRPCIPILFVYGRAKPFRFHSDRWLNFLLEDPRNKVVGLEGTGHWVTTDRRIEPIVSEWLDATGTNAVAVSGYRRASP